MTEKEYINTESLNAIRNSRDILRWILPKHTEGIDEKDYSNVMEMVSKWEKELNNNIKINDV